MTDNKNKLFAVKAITSPDVPVTKKEYKYRSKSRHAGRPREVATFSLEPEFNDKLERWAFWEELDKSEIMNAILSKALEGRDFDEIPRLSKEEKEAARQQRQNELRGRIGL